MFDRKAYKKEALKQLRGNWGVACAITAIGLFVIACFNSSDVLKLETPARLRSLLSLASICISGIFCLAEKFVYMNLNEIKNTSKKIDMDMYLSGLELWIKGAAAQLWFMLWIFLWALLFVIPGIVKFYSYSMMFFVIAENPEIGVKKAMSISKIMTHEHKADLFVMSLSFLGWSILSVMTAGIGFIWLNPYKNVSFLNAYFELKRMAFDTGKLKPADFEVSNE